MPIPLALLAAIPSLVQAGYGISQMSKANQYANTPRPNYEVPEEVMLALQNARQRSQMTELPGQERIEEKLAGRTAGSIRDLNLTGGGGPGSLGAINAIYGKEQEGIRDLGIEAARFMDKNQGVYRNELNRVAGYRDKAFQINEMEPYLNAMATASALRGAGTQNLFGGLSGATSAATGGVESKRLNDSLSQYNTGGSDFTSALGNESGFSPNAPTDLGALSDWERNMNLVNTIEPRDHWQWGSRY